MSYSNRLYSSQKGALNRAVDAIEDNNPGASVLGYDWPTNWAPIHGCKTSEMAGYKLACRRDTFAGGLLWVSLCPCSGKKMTFPAHVEVSFSREPTTTELVAALRRAIQEAS